MAKGLSHIIKQIREDAGISQDELAIRLDLSREMVSKMENGKMPVSIKTQVKIQELFGTKYVNFTSLSQDPKITEVEAATTYLDKRRSKKNESKQFLVPLVPVKAQAGYVRAADQSRFIDSMDEYALPPGVDPLGAVWRYWEVEGDSMEPAFHSGDFILTSQVHKMDWDNLRNFYLYVIVTDDLVLFKRIFCKNQLEWVLISENEDTYPQQLLQAEAVKEVWVFRRHIVNHAPPSKRFKINV